VKDLNQRPKDLKSFFVSIMSQFLGGLQSPPPQILGTSEFFGQQEKFWQMERIVKTLLTLSSEKDPKTYSEPY